MEFVDRRYNSYSRGSYSRGRSTEFSL